jgi:hypothetical protein
MNAFHRISPGALLILIITGSALGQTKTETGNVTSIPYLKLPEPRDVMADAQPWGGPQ